MADIKAGEEIIEYIAEINTIRSMLEDADKKIENIKNVICDSSEYYEGNAKEEISEFCISQMAHLEKMISFYNKASQFAQLYFTEMNFTDQELSETISSFFQNYKAG